MALKIPNPNFNNNNNQANNAQKLNTNTEFHNSNNSFNSTAQNTEKSPENNLVSILGQCLPFAPLVFEQFTGQKVPQMTGTIAELQQSINQLQTTLQAVINNQQVILNSVNNLETNANTGFHSLDKRIENLQSIRLTHEKERKQIEYNQPSKLESGDYE